MVACRSSTIRPAVYTYNGLGHRISEQTDTNNSDNDGAADGVADSYDPVFFMAVDPQGRRVATFRGTDTYAKEAFVYHPSGIRGPAFTGGVLLRDRNSDLTNPQLWASEAGGRFRTERTYYCTDFRGNVAALIDDAGALVEQYAYSQSGVPFGLPLGNVKSDGVVDAAHTSGTDWDVVNTISGGAYDARADLNLDGVVDSADLAIVTAQDGIATGRGKLAAPATGNRKGYAQGEVFGEGLQILWTFANSTSNSGTTTSRTYSTYNGSITSTQGFAFATNNKSVTKTGPYDNVRPCGYDSDPTIPGVEMPYHCKKWCDDHPDLGGITICPDRGQMPVRCCICLGNTKKNWPGEPQGFYDIVTACTIVHEQERMNTACELADSPGDRCTNCTAYRAQLACLREKQRDNACGDDVQCQDALRRFIDKQERRMSEQCQGCGGWSPNYFPDPTPVLW